MQPLCFVSKAVFLLSFFLFLQPKKGVDNRLHSATHPKKQEKIILSKMYKKRKNDKNRQQTTAVVYKCELYTQEKIKMWIISGFCIVEK